MISGERNARSDPSSSPISFLMDCVATRCPPIIHSINQSLSLDSSPPPPLCVSRLLLPVEKTIDAASAVGPTNFVFHPRDATTVELHLINCEHHTNAQICTKLLGQSAAYILGQDFFRRHEDAMSSFGQCHCLHPCRRTYIALTASPSSSPPFLILSMCHHSVILLVVTSPASNVHLAPTHVPS